MPSSLKLDGLEIRDRDLSLLRTLFECRVMSSTHAAQLFFDGSKEAAKKRLQKLKAANLIAVRPRRVNEPSVLFLTSKAFSLLQQSGILSEYPDFSKASLIKRASVSDLTLRHELAVMDVKVAFHAALRSSAKHSISEFTTWPVLNQFNARSSRHDAGEVLVKPDGFIRILEKEEADTFSEHTFFLELDRSTETQDTLVNRAACYLNYYQSGGFAVKCGASRNDYKDFPFRVLIVLQNAERRNNTIQRLLQNNPPILTHAYLSTLDEVQSDPTGRIWMRPYDYREATAGGIFDSAKYRPGHIYMRQSEREMLVEKSVKKHSLFE